MTITIDGYDGLESADSNNESEPNLTNPEERRRIEHNYYQGHALTNEEEPGDLDDIISTNDKDILVRIDKPKNYGTLSSHNIANERLDYMWKNIDVFGEAQPTDIPVSRKLWDRLKECCTRGKKNAVPRKHLLKNVCGIAKSGELLAILGSSGAGKTTLLNSLAFRSPPGVKISSSAVRALNGVPVDARAMRSRCAYVQQDDLFIGSLTAKEHLIFQCADTIIGVPGVVKGLSGGERKRLAFASEALTDPNLLLCDEPTSGLDSFMAANVLQVLKNLANKGKTIILTIHQPSSELFSLFDKILLMAEGRVAFLGTPSEATQFFDNLAMPCPQNYNPADYYVQKLAIAPNNEAECRSNIKSICDSFAVSSLARGINEQIRIHRAESLYLHPLETIGSGGYRATWSTQFIAILWRSWLSVLKEPMLVKVRLLQTTVR
uniref:Protein white n=1 Tax=Culicoides sonorensis TaxID=179676 RepID=A0A336LVT6_CULSO